MMMKRQRNISTFWKMIENRFFFFFFVSLFLPSSFFIQHSLSAVVQTNKKGRCAASFLLSLHVRSRMRNAVFFFCLLVLKLIPAIVIILLFLVPSLFLFHSTMVRCFFFFLVHLPYEEAYLKICIFFCVYIIRCARTLLFVIVHCSHMDDHD